MIATGTHPALLAPLTVLAPLAALAPLLSGGALAGISFVAIVVFGALAVASLTRHIRRSRQVWEGEVNGGIPLTDEPDHAAPSASADAEQHRTRQG